MPCSAAPYPAGDPRSTRANWSAPVAEPGTVGVNVTSTPIVWPAVRVTGAASGEAANGAIVLTEVTVTVRVAVATTVACLVEETLTFPTFVCGALRADDAGWPKP